MVKRHLIQTFFIFLILSSCSSKKDLLPNVSGKPGEVVIIIEKNLWNSSIGEELKKHLMVDYPALPQDEPTFSLYPLPPENFNDIFQLSRNIIFININSVNDSIIYTRDKWAKPQLVIKIMSKDINKMTELIKNKGQEIKEIILNEERTRLKMVYNKFREKSLINVLKKHYIDLIIPTGYRLNLDTNGFIWISYETPYMSQGLFVYSVPYKDTSIFNPQNVVSIRDSVLKRYIPGPLEGTYMTTEHLYPVEEKRFTLNNQFAYEIRGLWKIENDFMGGPFVNISTVVKNKVVFVEGYVYAPKDDKKTYVWQLEAILYSLKQINNI